MDHVGIIREQSARFHDVLTGVDPDAPVPSCPDWTAADLVWHLAEVQHFWGSMAGELLAGPEAYDRPDRPADGELLDLFTENAARLVEAVARHDPATPCWSWHAEGGSIGWVRRRQAHEALIHRIDAELAAGAAVAGVAAGVAADGVDEMLRVMMHGVPPWGTFTPDGDVIGLAATDTGDAWTLTMGRFDGTSPDSGKVYEGLDAAMVAAGAPAPEATLRAPAWDLDRWLWGRGEPAAVDGDPARRDRLRRLAAEVGG